MEIVVLVLVFLFGIAKNALDEFMIMRYNADMSNIHAFEEAPK